MIEEKRMQLQTVSDTIENCRYCLMCRHVCPVGHVTRKETLTPHGWGLMIASVDRGMISWNEETLRVLYSCADCGTCRSHCVTDQALPDAIAATRAKVATHEMAPARIKEVHKALQEWGNPYEQISPEKTNGQAKVAVFVGDDAKFLQQETMDHVIKLIESTGVKPMLIGIGRNNGHLASSLGFPETAKNLIQATLDELRASQAKHLLVLSPGDHYVFDRLFKERLDGQWPEDIKLQEVVAYLLEKQGSGELKFRPSNDDRPYAYVDPTHSLRVPGRFVAPRRLLSLIMPGDGRELFWRKERSHPSGNGALQFTNPHISDHLAYARLADGRDSGAQLLITEDPGCLHHLDKFANRFGLKMQGFYELLADHLS